MMIEPHGHILAVDGATSKSGQSLVLQNATERAGLMRQEGDKVVHKHRTMHERRIWAKTHGNLYATHRLLHRTVAWSQLYAFKLPSTLTGSVIIPVISAFLLCGCGLSIFHCVMQLRRGSARDLAGEDGDGGSGGLGEGEGASPVEHDFHRSPDPLDEDIYGMGIAALIRDTQRMAMGTECFQLRVTRLLLSMMTLIFTMILQVFLLVQMKILVTSVSTNQAQDTYQKYEIWMYGNDRSRMNQLDDGQVRGKEEFFDPKQFAGLTDDLKDAICQVPLSQPTFFIGILLVWTLVCFSELRHSFDLAGSLVWSTPTIPSMKESIEETEKTGDEAVIVVGLTTVVKVVATVFIIIPRMLVSLVLLWLGCRWLTGTFGFSDVLQNAVALEFILLLKDIFYDTITPAHNKKETVNTLVKPFCENERPTVSIFLGSFTWGVLAIVFVVAYVLAFQQVLPDYQWDVHDACVDYLAGVEKATPD